MELWERKKRKIELPQKCWYCKGSATKALIWAEGRAYIPVCQDHEKRATSHLHSEGNEVDGVRDIPTDPQRPRRHEMTTVSKDGLQEAIYWTDEDVGTQARNFADTVIKTMVIQQGGDGLYQTTWVGALGVREKTPDALRNRVYQDILKSQKKDLTAMYRKEPKAHYVGKTTAGSGPTIARLQKKMEANSFLTVNELLMEKRGLLINGVPRETALGDQTPEPLPEAKDEVYWKNVSSKHKVTTKDGKSFQAQMPDGPKRVDWKPEEAGEARKALSKLAGFKESITLDEGDEVTALITAILAATRGKYDQNALYQAGGKQVRIVSSNHKVRGYHLVLVTDKSFRPLGAPFHAGALVSDLAGGWKPAVETVIALAKHGK